MNPVYRSWVYRIWVFGGLAVVAGVVVAIGLSWQPGEPPPYWTFGAVLGVYLFGVLALQAFGLARSRPSAAVTAPLPIDPTRPPADTEALIQTLALPDDSGSRRRRASEGDRQAWRSSVAQFVSMAAAAIMLPLAGLLWVSGAVPQAWYPFGPTGMGIPVAAIPGLLIVLVLVVLLPRTLGRARRTADDTMAPLGLAITKLPTSMLLSRVGSGGLRHHVVGPTVLGGERFGRRVVVEADSGKSAVLVSCPATSFQLRVKAGRLVPVGRAPASVATFASALPQDPRWNRVTVAAGPDGIRIDRKGRSLDRRWLLDLWLAEQLAELPPS